MESKPFEYMGEEKFGDSSCIYGFLARDENYPLHKTMVAMTINESCLFEGGKSVTRSTESCLKGRGEVNGMGASGGRVE